MQRHGLDVHGDTGRLGDPLVRPRWRHPAKGIIDPTVFIPLAEESDLILEIGEWVLREALEMVKRARKNIHPKFQISIKFKKIITLVSYFTN